MIVFFVKDEDKLGILIGSVWILTPTRILPHFLFKLIKSIKKIYEYFLTKYSEPVVDGDNHDIAISSQCGAIIEVATEIMNSIVMQSYYLP